MSLYYITEVKYTCYLNYVGYLNIYNIFVYKKYIYIYTFDQNEKKISSLKGTT